MVRMAIEKAGSLDSTKVRAAYTNAEFKGTTQGDLKFNEKGVCRIENVAMQWWNGERMPIWPPHPDVWKLRLMPVGQ